MAKALSPDIMGNQISIGFGVTSLRGAASKSSEASLPGRLALWLERHRERRQMRKDLPRLTNEMLKDLHLTRRQAQELANRPFWRA